MLAGQPGYQKLVSINGHQLTLNAPMTLYPQQELTIKDFIQGGPRSQFYEMGQKIVKGNLSFPLTIDGHGDVDIAIKELLECAQYPLRDLNIDTNYILAKEYITADDTDERYNVPNTGFNVYRKMMFERCCVEKMTIELPENGNASISMDIIGITSKTTSSPVYALSPIGMLRREVSYADCDIYLTQPAYHWDTAKSFTLTLENEIKPIYTFIDILDKETWTDLPKILAIGKTHLQGEIKYAVDRGTAAAEQASLPAGGWSGTDLTFDISGTMIINIPRMIADLTQQPIELGLLQRTTKFVGLFRSTILTDQEGHFITFK